MLFTPWPIRPKGYWGTFQKAYKLLSLRALKFSTVYINHIFQYMGKIFYVKFHTKYLTHIHVYFI